MEKKTKQNHELMKDDILELRIEDIGSEGEGIGHADGLTLFVKDAVPGDIVKAKIIKMKKSYGYARLLEVLKPSEDRVKPLCPVAKQCGGCQLQQLSYEKQLEFKENKIRNCLSRIGGFDCDRLVIEPIIGMEAPYYYRNKAQFPVERKKSGEIAAGFYAGRTHSIIDITECYIQDKESSKILAIFKAFLKEYNISIYDEKSHTGLVRRILTRVGRRTGEIMVCIIINGTSLPNSRQLVERLCELQNMTSICLNVNMEKTNVILGEQVVTLWGRDYITDYIGSIQYRISALSFYQVNPVQTEKLYETALKFAGLEGNETVWDLYCGIGTISLFLAKEAKQVYGVEIIPQAVADARANAEQNGIQNAEFFAGPAEEVVPHIFRERKAAADVVVVDPPRKGCDASLLNTIVEMQPKRIVYVSCDPATLARDLKFLCGEGYELVRVRGCDMFAGTVHVETAVLLVRKP